VGSRVKATEAHAIGLIHKAVPADHLAEAAKVYTDYYANAPTKSIGILKKMLNKSSSASLDAMLEYEAYCQEIAGTSQDYKEGVAAFLEKRKPNFTGK